MSELQKLLQQKSPPATPATLATEGAKSSKSSNCSKGPDAEKRFLSNDKLRLLAGTDWTEIRLDPDQLAGLRAAAETAEQIQRGEVPDHYTGVTECEGCGPVSVFPGLPSKVPSCPWCLARIRGVKVPRAK